MIIIFLSFQSKKIEVAAFLDELHKLLESDDFDINTDLNLIRKKKQGDDQEFSTPYTLLDLDYDAEDVVNRLKELKNDSSLFKFLFIKNCEYLHKYKEICVANNFI